MQYFVIYDSISNQIIGFLRKYIDKKIYDIDIIDFEWKNDLFLLESQKFKEVMDYLMDKIIVKEENPELWQVTADHFLVDALSAYEKIRELEQNRKR